MKDKIEPKAAKNCDLYDTVAILRNHMEESIHSAQEQEEDLSLDSYDGDLIHFYEELLQQSPSASIMLKEVIDQGWSFDLCDLGDVDFTVDYENQILELNHQGLSEQSLASSPYFRNMILFALIRGLRDIGQENRIHNISAHYKPEDMLMIDRIRCADMDVLAILVAWELRNENYNSLWRYLIGSEHGDMAMAFSRALEKQTIMISGGENFLRKAMISCFDQWFAGEKRVAECEREALDYMDTLLNAEEDAYYKLGKETLTAGRIEFLSCLPSKTAYLEGLGADMLMNPRYAGLNDEVNQSHLFHIIYDMQVTYRGGVPFRNSTLAEKIFPEGCETLH